MLCGGVSLDANKQVVTRWIKLWNEQGVAGVDEIFADDFRDAQLSTALGRPVTLELFKSSLRSLIEAMGHAQFDEHELLAEGDQVMVRWTVRGVHQGLLWGLPATGKAFALEGVNVFRVRDGRIVERQSYLDPGGVLGLFETTLPP
jgi:steroid delta-isomerase-like uncharacterized protein